MKKWLRFLALAALVATVAGACGGDGATGAGGGEEDLSIDIQEPADGDEVAIPFTLEFSSSEEIGSTDTGKHHIHVWYDGNEDEYEVVEEESFEVTELSSGEHTITASLRNADHSAAGAEDEIKVTVTGGGGGGGDEDDDGY